MTTHSEAAMTREQVLEALTSLLPITGKLSSAGGENLTLRNARSELRRWGEKYNDSLDRALASTRQEPAPAADAEEVAKFAFKIACDWGHSQCAPIAADAILKDRALRRYAGDGVTDAMVEAATDRLARFYSPGLRSLAKDAARSILQAAARAKSGEKDGAR